jgi:hypothetical protein
VVAPIHHLHLAAGGIAEHVEVMVDQIQLVQGLLQLFLFMTDK